MCGLWSCGHIGHIGKMANKVHVPELFLRFTKWFVVLLSVCGRRDSLWKAYTSLREKAERLAEEGGIPLQNLSRSCGLPYLRAVMRNVPEPISMFLSCSGRQTANARTTPAEHQRPQDLARQPGICTRKRRVLWWKHGFERHPDRGQKTMHTHNAHGTLGLSRLQSLGIYDEFGGHGPRGIVVSARLWSRSCPVPQRGPERENPIIVLSHSV